MTKQELENALTLIDDIGKVVDSSLEADLKVRIISQLIRDSR